MKTILLVALSLACSLSASAATIQPVSGNLTASVLFSADFSSVLAFDFRSDAAFVVSNPAPLGIVLTGDFGAASPNAVIVASDSPASEFGTLTFITGLAVFSPDKQMLSVPVVGTPGGPLAKPELIEFLKATGSTFALQGVTPFADSNLAIYSLDSLTQTSVPEPGTAILMAFGMGAVGLLRMRLRK